MAMISKRTVLNAIAWLALYGFLDRLRHSGAWGELQNIPDCVSVADA